MKSIYHSRCINSPFDDPGVYVSSLFDKKAFLFDAGELKKLSPKDILKIECVFISHTHMDHFVGFDTLLRLLLGRDKQLLVYGPEGFLKNLEGKLSAYTWNLVNTFSQPFTIIAAEVTEDRLITQRYQCGYAFIPQQEPLVTPFSGILYESPSITVSSVILDHKIPCLAFSLAESFHINILKDRLDELGLLTGPWIKDFKQALYRQQDMNTEFSVPDSKFGSQTFLLGDLAHQISLISKGQKISYITDAVYNESNMAKMITIAQHADHLYIEAGFLEEEKQIAQEKYHLTATQAGMIAGKAKVKRFTLFHFSPRYINRESELWEQARQAYEIALNS